MPRLNRLTSDTAVGASRDLLADLEARHGRPGDMVATMANSPAVLGGYLQLSRAMGRAKLDRAISERISIAVQAHQGCGLCLDAHTAAARARGVDDEEIERARRGTSADPAIAAIIALALRIHREPTSITDEQVGALREYGYSDRAIADVVGVVALNVLTGSFNLLAGLTPGSDPDA
ncbi:carboxymuconolactone decarboxylase family protein [Streptomyces sp. NPDC020875]|uniref:carboxymuconolactone decarboxylase family protein n=1 Tax=Streptomyces sp. NPDC020875 TaxID=3154898 RepID=UPI00340167DD